MQIGAAVCASRPSHANWIAIAAPSLAEKEGWELGLDDAFSIHVRGATHLS